MRIVRAAGGAEDESAARAAAAILEAGGLVVLPTETVYGLCADASRPDALRRIFEAKGRDEGKPVAWLVTGIGDAERSGAAVTPAAASLAKAFWPGPLTLVLPVRGGLQGFRVPDHPVPLAVIRLLGRAVAATSANRSGEPDARTAADAARAVGAAVGLIVDAGPSPGGVPSTVVRCDREGWTILRAGAIEANRIARTAGGNGTAA